MKSDKYGQQIYTEDDLVDLYLQNNQINLKKVYVTKNINFDPLLDIKNIPYLEVYKEHALSIEEFDKTLQRDYFIPDSYKQMDIAKYLLDLCKNEQELQRVGEELLMFQERNMFDFLKYMKYLVDTMRINNIVWGVGRGSSVASFVLFLIGIHKINSIYYDLSIDEFLK